MIRPVGQAVKTPPFHGGNSSSILLRVTKNKKRENVVLSFLFFLIRPLTRIQVNGAKRKPCLYRFPKTDADLIDNFPPFTVEQRRCLCSVRSSATGHHTQQISTISSIDFGSVLFFIMSIQIEYVIPESCPKKVSLGDSYGQELSFKSSGGLDLPTRKKLRNWLETNSLVKEVFPNRADCVL